MKRTLIFILLSNLAILLIAQINHYPVRLLSPGNTQIAETIYNDYPIFYYENATNYLIRITEINDIERDNALIYSQNPIIEERIINEHWQYPDYAEQLKSGKTYAWYLYNDSLNLYSEIFYFKKILFEDRIISESLLNLLLNNFPEDENINELIENGFKPTGKIHINGVKYNIVSFSIFLKNIINKDICITTGIINEEN